MARAVALLFGVTVIPFAAELPAAAGRWPLIRGIAAADALELVQHGAADEPDVPPTQALIESVPVCPALVYVQLAFPVESVLQLEGLQKPRMPVFGPEMTLKATWTLDCGVLF